MLQFFRCHEKKKKKNNNNNLLQRHYAEAVLSQHQWGFVFVSFLFISRFGFPRPHNHASKFTAGRYFIPQGSGLFFHGDITGGWGGGNGWGGVAVNVNQSSALSVSGPTGPRRLRLRKAHRTAASSRRNLGRRVLSLQRSGDGGGPTRRASLFQEVAPTAQSRETRVCLR